VSELGAKAIEVARQYLTVREVTPNRHPDIDRWLKACGVKPPAAYCAAFVSWCVLRASEGRGFKDSAGALRLVERNPDRKLEPIDAAVLLATPEPVIFVIDHGQGKGHAGFALSIDGDTMTTLEANTGPGPAVAAKDRDGDGVHLRTDRQFYDVHHWIRL
jgi:hypothetical protein